MQLTVKSILFNFANRPGQVHQTLSQGKSKEGRTWDICHACKSLANSSPHSFFHCLHALLFSRDGPEYSTNKILPIQMAFCTKKACTTIRARNLQCSEIHRKPDFKIGYWTSQTQYPLEHTKQISGSFSIYV